ncbi:hypothetical protein HMPREF0578_1361 [Mobiluncus mulieris 28-1]|nr:hypothetical protein HMPREF0577_2044 [Mobiluncus mulieris ATCC 35243]EEZ92032.1 hypothetical protein HMPREF0578_1361 [Mobiluncus mulieris 28-1]
MCSGGVSRFGALFSRGVVFSADRSRWFLKWVKSVHEVPFQMAPHEPNTP